MLEGTKIVLSSLQQSLRYVFLSTLFCALLRTSHKKNTTGLIISYSLKWAGFFFFFFFLGGGGGRALAWFLRRNEAGISRRQQSVKGTL